MQALCRPRSMYSYMSRRPVLVVATSLCLHRLRALIQHKH